MSDLGHCCYGGKKTREDCASCGAWRPDRSPLIDRLVTVENDPTVPAYARKVAADAVWAMDSKFNHQKE